MNDEQTNFERAESKMPVEAEEPSILEQAQNIPGLNAEFVQPVIKPVENINEPLPNTGEGLHGEDVSTPTQTPQTSGPAPSKPVLATFPQEKPPGEVGMPVSPLETLPGRVSILEGFEQRKGEGNK